MPDHREEAQLRVYFTAPTHGPNHCFQLEQGPQGVHPSKPQKLPAQEGGQQIRVPLW
jgi:hypothetical protein